MRGKIFSINFKTGPDSARPLCPSLSGCWSNPRWILLPDRESISNANYIQLSIITGFKNERNSTWKASESFSNEKKNYYNGEYIIVVFRHFFLGPHCLHFSTMFFSIYVLIGILFESSNLGDSYELCGLICLRKLCQFFICPPSVFA